jgi:hypothetical protein
VWFTRSWPSWAQFWMYRRDISPRNGVRSLILNAPDMSLHSISRLFPHLNELYVAWLASVSIVDSASPPPPLVNVHTLIFANPVEGVELLLDGVMLPRLRCLYGDILPLFVAFARRPNQLRSFDMIDYLVITDADENSFSLKHLHTVLDAVPRLRTLIISLSNAMCPSLELADLIVDYARRTQGQSFVLSFSFNGSGDQDCKKHFCRYLERAVEMTFPNALFALTGETKIYIWM